MRKVFAESSDIALAAILGLTTVALQTYAYLVG